jgi:hypothetical protein
MSPGKIKFRCFQCNTLLGVSPTKAGTIVGCPKCAAELVVPDPNEVGAVPGVAGSAGPDPDSDPGQLFRNLIEGRPPAGRGAEAAPEALPTMESPPPFLTGPAPSATEGGSPFAFLQGQEPESLRAESATRKVKATPSRPRTESVPFPPLSSAEPPATAPASPSTSPLAFLQAAESAPVQAEPATAQDQSPLVDGTPRRAKSVPMQTEPVSPPLPAAPTPATETPASDLSFSAIQVEPAPLREPPPPPVPPLRVQPPGVVADRATAVRRNDVILPRTAVVLWSFFVLVALVVSFAAGMLAGRFVWAPSARADTAGSSGPAAPAPSSRSR